MNLIVNNPKMSHNVTHDVVFSTVISYHKYDIVLAQEIEACVIYFLHENIKSQLLGKVNW